MDVFMNIDPNLIKPDKPLKLKEVKKGLYVVENAYNGIYEYFKGRPICRIEDGKVVESYLV